MHTMPFGHVWLFGCPILSRKNQTHTNTHNQNKQKTRITLPYIHTTSEMTARLLRSFNIDVAHKPTCKLRSNFTINTKTKQMLLTNVTPSTSFHAKTAPKSTLDKHQRKYRQDRPNAETLLTNITIVHFQLNAQTTTDINLTGLKRDVLDKLQPNMPVSLRNHGIVCIN